MTHYVFYLSQVTKNVITVIALDDNNPDSANRKMPNQGDKDWIFIHTYLDVTC